MEYIASQENLEAFVRRAASSSVLAIDTEFLREKTYYANLCLIQLATDAEVAVVDPFAIEDMKVLAPLLTDSSIVKLFHISNFSKLQFDISLVHENLPRDGIFDIVVANTTTPWSSSRRSKLHARPRRRVPRAPRCDGGSSAARNAPSSPTRRWMCNTMAR